MANYRIRIMGILKCVHFCPMRVIFIRAGPKAELKIWPAKKEISLDSVRKK